MQPFPRRRHLTSGTWSIGNVLLSRVGYLRTSLLNLASPDLAILRLEETTRARSKGHVWIELLAMLVGNFSLKRPRSPTCSYLVQITPPFSLTFLMAEPTPPGPGPQVSISLAYTLRV